MADAVTAPIHPQGPPPDARLVDALPAPVFVVQDHRFVYVNRAFAEVMGLPPEALVGHLSVERVHPDDRDVIQKRQSAAAAGRRSDSSAQIRIRCGDGAERSVIVTTTLIEYDGRSAVLGTMVDVTVQSDAVNMSVRMAALGRLAGGVAHDFNNLLLVIGGQVERLQHALPAGLELRHGIDAIGAAAERAAILTDQLLSFGRGQMLTPQVTDLSAMLGELGPQLRARLGSAIELTLDVAETLPPIRADRPRLRQVLRHLADNARDAMPSGGRLTLAVDAVEVDGDLRTRWAFLARGGRFVRLRVIDTGAGMDPEVLPHVFEPFFTTKGRGRGAGMGLASVYGIVKQSAGYVFIERTGAEGTCVTILLPPLTAREAGAGRPAPAPARPAVPERPRVLLVEDEMAVREMLADGLAQQGFDVLPAETAEQAGLLARDQPFDLLLTDIDLPGQNGAELASSLRARFPQLAVVLMSGYPDDGAITEAGLNDEALLRKPFSMAQLVARMREVLATGPGAGARRPDDPTPG
jgi:two-component system cell cycle sensor histidine kinase/response regulator CckA